MLTEDNNNFAPVQIGSFDPVTVENTSKEITVDETQILSDIETISQDYERDGELIEQNMYIVFNKAENLITSVLLPTDNNTSRESDNPMTTYPTHSTVEGNTNLAIVAQLHSHPDLNPGSSLQNSSSFGETKLQVSGGSRELNELGISQSDKKLANENYIQIYAIATYMSRPGGNGLIYSSSDPESALGRKSISSLETVKNNPKKFLNYVFINNK